MSTSDETTSLRESSEIIAADEAATAAAIGFPRRLAVSGRYEWRMPLLPFPHPLPMPFGAAEPGELIAGGEQPDAELGAELGVELGDGADGDAAAGALPILPIWFRREELRLDVDGPYPQMTASGTLYNGRLVRVHWIARLVRIGVNRFTGGIWYKDGTAAALPHTRVTIVVTRAHFPFLPRAIVRFSGGGVSARTVRYAFRSRSFHDVAFEFDCAQGTTAVTRVHTHAHPNRPAGLPAESLSIETAFRRAGFAVSRSGDDVVPISLAGANARWSDAEMHDAMQAHWSRFANRPQWAMWTFFASLHEMGTGLGGIMFDDIGPQHRQGTAIFEDSFIANAPAGDPAPAAWVQRMRFWTACHEMGHSFNLAHSWQKSLGTPWIPLPNEPEARSFMNYPYRVAGGEDAFFADFRYRFSDAELLFLRHAPAKFVQMGNADWFDHHGFERDDGAQQCPLRLEIRVNRSDPTFEFLEPVVLELKLTNVSDRVQTVDEAVLAGDHDTVVVLKKEGRPAREWLPYARYCRHHREVALDPGESRYGSLFVSAGLNGWDIADPGRYLVQVAIRHAGLDVLSAPLALRVLPPADRKEENIAQDLFCEDVGRVLAFDGTRYLTAANDTLREVCKRLPSRRVACHAQVALATPDMRPYKTIDFAADEPAVAVHKPKAADVNALKKALVDQAEAAAITLGHIDYHDYVARLATSQEDKGDAAGAADSLRRLHGALAKRKVLPRVLAAIQREIDRVQPKRKGGGDEAAAAETGPES